MRQPSSEKHKQWNERLSRFRASGQTGAAFCRTEGYSQASFYQWKKKLTAAQDNGLAGTSPSRKPTGSLGLAASTNSFKTVELRTLSRASTTIRLSDHIEIQLGSDLPTVATVIDQLAKHVDSVRNQGC